VRSCSAVSRPHPGGQLPGSETGIVTAASLDPPLPLAHQLRPTEAHGPAQATAGRRSVAVLDLESMRTPGAPGVRVHVEQDDTGLHVWVGVDAHDPALAARAASLLATVLAAPTSGTYRLATLVCNGTTLYADAGTAISLPHQEQPWPSAH
jgi:hypothetical protein